MVGSVDTEATAGERFPEGTLVGSCESVDISLDPSITGRQDWMGKSRIN